MKSIAYWLVFTSQMPSQARSTYCVYASIGSIRTSGNAETAWSFARTCGLLLYSKSPRARERASMPLTRPSSTNPPERWMRDSSPALSGLWSSDISLARPPRDITVRESPALAQIISVRVTKITVAVQPAKLFPDSKPPPLSVYSSMSLR